MSSDFNVGNVSNQSNIPDFEPILDIEGMPKDLIDEIFFKLKEDDFQSLNQTSKFWAEKTVEPLKKNLIATNQFISSVSTKLVNLLSEKYKNQKDHLTRLTDSKIFESTNFVEITSFGLKKLIQIIGILKTLDKVDLEELHGKIRFDFEGDIVAIAYNEQELQNQYNLNRDNCYVELSGAWLALGSIKKGLECARKIDDKFERGLALESILEKVCTRHNDTTKALEILKEIQEITYNFDYLIEEGYKKIAKAFARNGNVDEAFTIIREKFKNRKQEFLEAVLSEFINKDLEKALKIIKAKTNQDDNLDQVYSLIANKYEKEGETEKATEYISKIKDESLKEDIAKYRKER